MRTPRIRAARPGSDFGGLLFAIVGIVGLAAASDGRADSPETRRTPHVLHSTPETPKHDLRVAVLTRSAQGEVFCAIWREAEGYPVDHTRAVHEESSHEFSDRQVRIGFSEVEEGAIAIACFHDENGNQTLDTNFLGIPSEGTGASEGARGWMGPPRFEDARVTVSGEGPFDLTIRIEY